MALQHHMASRTSINIGLDNALLPVLHQAINGTNADLLYIGPLQQTLMKF